MQTTKTAAVDADDLLTTEQVAKMLQVKINTLVGWRMQKRGPQFTRIERVVRYTREAVREYLAAGTVETATSKK